MKAGEAFFKEEHDESFCAGAATSFRKLAAASSGMQEESQQTKEQTKIWMQHSGASAKLRIRKQQKTFGL